MGAIIELGLNLVTRITLPPETLFARVFGIRIPTLDHKPFDDAVKRGSVIKPFAGESFEILDRFRGHVGPELKHHVTLGGLDYSNLVGRGRCFWVRLGVRGPGGD